MKLTELQSCYFVPSKYYAAAHSNYAYVPTRDFLVVFHVSRVACSVAFGVFPLNLVENNLLLSRYFSDQWLFIIIIIAIHFDL